MLAHHPAWCGLFVWLVLVVAPVSLAQAKDPWLVDSGRDVHFDNTLLFTEPWLWPIDLDSLVPEPKKGPKPSFAQSWLATSQYEKLMFLEGYGDQVLLRCMAYFGGDNPKARSCAAPLLPLPQDLVLADMDAIYRDARFANSRYDLVLQAAVRRVSGEDWQGFLAQAK